MKGVFQELGKQIKSIGERGSFVNNFAWVTSIRSLTVIVAFICTPVISRLYTPEDYGYFALYSAILTNCLRITTLRFPNAIVLPKFQRVSVALTQLSFISLLIWSILFQSLIEINPFDLVGFLKINELGIVKHFLWLALIIYGINEIFSGIITRHRLFRSGAFLAFISTSFSKTFTIVYGWIGNLTKYGLILGDICLYVANNILYAGKLRGELNHYFKFESKRVLVFALKRYKKFPLLLAPNGFIAQLQNRLPIILLTPAYGIEKVGFFSFASILLELPVKFLGDKGLNALLSENLASKTHQHQYRNIYQTVRKLFLTQVLISIIIYTVMFTYSEEIYAFFFGKEWFYAGTIASVLSIKYASLLISSFINPVIKVINKLEFGLFFRSLLLAAEASGILIMVHFNVDFFHVVIGIAVLECVSYLFYSLLVMVQLKKLKNGKVL